MLFGRLQDTQVTVLRDGGTIVASYSNFWGTQYSLTLPVKWEGKSKEEMRVVGYTAPFLEKLVKTKKISKGDGKPFYTTSFVKVEISNLKASKLARKIVDSCQDNERKLATKLLNGVLSGNEA